MASNDTVRLPSIWEGFGDLNSSTAACTMDWRCSYCGSLNPEHLYRCDNCYAPRDEMNPKDDLR